MEWPVASTDLIRDTTNPVALDATFFTSKWANVQKPAEAIRRFDVFLSLEGKADGAPGMAKPGDTIDVKYGVPVRFPATGILHVCTDAPCGTTGSKEIKKVEGPVLQFGRMYMVPVSGKAFRSTSTAIAYDATGNPTSVEVADKTSLISTLTSTAKSAATSIAGIPAAVSAAELARTKAKTDQETAEIALATAQANGATIEQLAPLQAQTALTTAQTAQINAQTALTAAQKVSTP